MKLRHSEFYSHFSPACTITNQPTSISLYRLINKKCVDLPIISYDIRRGRRDIEVRFNGSVFSFPLLITNHHSTIAPIPYIILPIALSKQMSHPWPLCKGGSMFDLELDCDTASMFIYCSFWGACSQNCEKRLVASSCLSVRPFASMEQLGFRWTDFYEIWCLRISFSKTCLENSNLIKIWQE